MHFCEFFFSREENAVHFIYSITATTDLFYILIFNDNSVLFKRLRSLHSSFSRLFLVFVFLIFFTFFAHSACHRKKTKLERPTRFIPILSDSTNVHWHFDNFYYEWRGSLFIDIVLKTAVIYIIYKTLYTRRC